MRRALAAALVCASVAGVAAEDPVDVVIGRAAKYVEGCQRDFAMVVSEERYAQEARYPPVGRGSDHRRRPDRQRRD
jgi:hypothetical protein